MHRRLALVASLLITAACGGEGPRTPACQSSSEPLIASGFCAPPSIAANQPLRLQIQEQCGGCQKRADRCEVQVQGQEITLRLLGQTCTLPPNTGCPAICSVNIFDCTVPALAPGTYRVSAQAGVATPVMMTASPALSATSCSLPRP